MVVLTSCPKQKIPAHTKPCVHQYIAHKPAFAIDTCHPGLRLPQNADAAQGLIHDPNLKRRAVRAMSRKTYEVALRGSSGGGVSSSGQDIGAGDSLRRRCFGTAACISFKVTDGGTNGFRSLVEALSTSHDTVAL